MRHSRPVGTPTTYEGLDDPYKECADFIARYTPLCLHGVPARELSPEDLRLALSLSGYSKDIVRDPRFHQHAITEIARLIKQRG